MSITREIRVFSRAVPHLLKETRRALSDEAYATVEAARGELGYYVVSDGTENAYRVKIRTGSFTGTQIMQPLGQGVLIADIVALFASFDIVAPELDR